MIDALTACGGMIMKIELYHASKLGNGATIAEEFRRIMEAKGHQVDVHHNDQFDPRKLPPADLYVFGSPTRFGGALKIGRRRC